jgi:UDP-N-acetylglucosamine 2-epimerase (non-hydrolysing)
VRIVYVVGTRPNFVKMAPVIAAMRRRAPDGRHAIVHTGQHYDRLMSEVFLDELGVPAPDHMLGVGSGTHGEQTARVIERLEPVLAEERPDVVLVPGDVNSTLAAALTAAKLEIRLGHVESGLRSFDRSMPEEINRVLADQLSDLLFLHSEDAAENLRREGIAEERMHFVGNTMIDTLVSLEPRFRAEGAPQRLGLEKGAYLLVTLHRPALVDGPLLGDAMARLAEVGRDMPVVFPVHPRTRKMLQDGAEYGVTLTDPVGYLDFLSLEADAGAVLTDSGGIQEETTFLGVHCFTLRANTERPVTVRAGTNTVLGLDPARIAEIPALLEAREPAPADPPPLWDGRAAERVADVLVDG